MLAPLLLNNFLGGGNAAPVFVGPSISTINIVLNVTMSPRDFSVLFNDSDGDVLTFSVGGTLPTGVTLSSAGILSGTPTVAGTFAGISVSASDPDLEIATSNTFSIVVAASPTPPPAGGARDRSVVRNLRGMGWGR